MIGEISDKIKNLRNELEKGLRSLDADLLETASLPLTGLQNELRETIQENMREKAKDVISKLKWNKTLDIDDMKIIERWIVGDAEFYTEIENNFNDWVEECKRLHHMLSIYENASIENDEIKMFKLNALLTDLKYTLEDVKRYVNSKNRIKNFKQSMNTGQIDKETKKWLAGMIKEQLDSQEY